LLSEQGGINLAIAGIDKRALNQIREIRFGSAQNRHKGFNLRAIAGINHARDKAKDRLHIPRGSGAVVDCDGAAEHS
jgi:hypothetical protein